MEKKTIKFLDEDPVDRRIPLALVLAVLIEAASVVWWASAKERDLFFLTDRIERLETTSMDRSNGEKLVLDRLARIEERLSAQIRILDEIEKNLHR